MSPAPPANGTSEAPRYCKRALRFGARFRFGLRLHHFLFVALTIIAGTPIFYLVKELPTGRLGLGVFTTRYLVSLQQTIVFGDRGEATRAIRQIEGFQGRRTPIIALTAHAMEGSREASLESGMDDQITKPLTMAALIGKLLQWLAPTETS